MRVVSDSFTKACDMRLLFCLNKCNNRHFHNVSNAVVCFAGISVCSITSLWSLLVPVHLNDGTLNDVNTKAYAVDAIIVVTI